MTAEIACHPLFVATLETKGPLARPVETIDVERLKGTGPKKRFVFVDWVRAEELPDERALADRFGAGVYKLTAKNLDRNCFIRSTTLEVDGEELDDETDDAAAPAPAAPAAAGSTDLLLKMLLEDRRDREKRDEQDRLERERRHERELARQHEHSETLLKTVTTFANTAMQMASGGRGAGMREMLEFANTLRANESEARIAAIAEREALEETIQERAASAEKEGDLIDAAFKPIIEKVGARVADKVAS